MAVTNRRGIFSLLDVRERQGAGVWAVKADVFLTPSPFIAPSPASFGYFGGGERPSSYGGATSSIFLMIMQIRY